jgi:toxin ParE1/3/4
MKSLRIAEAAQTDLRDIKQYTERTWGAAQARRYLDEFRARFALLRKRSQLGRPREELGTGLRSLPSGGHVIFYRDMDDRIEVVRILHASMDVRRHFKVASQPRSRRRSR